MAMIDIPGRAYMCSQGLRMFSLDAQEIITECVLFLEGHIAPLNLKECAHIQPNINGSRLEIPINWPDGSFINIAFNGGGECGVTTHEQDDETWISLADTQAVVNFIKMAEQRNASLNRHPKPDAP